MDLVEESLLGRSIVINIGGKGKFSLKSVKMLRSLEGKVGYRLEESIGWYRGGRMF